MNSESDYLERVRDKYGLPIKLGCKRCLRPLYKNSYNLAYCAQCITSTLPHILDREVRNLYRSIQLAPEEWSMDRNAILPHHFDGALSATPEGVELIIEGLEPGTCPQVIEYLDSSLRLYIPDAVIGVQSLKHPENLLEHKRAYRRFAKSRFEGLYGISNYASDLFCSQNISHPTCFYCNGELKGGIKGTPFDLYIPICQGLSYNTFYYVHLCPPCAETGEHDFIRELRRAENPHSLQRIREERYRLQRYDEITSQPPVGWSWR